MPLPTYIGKTNGLGESTSMSLSHTVTAETTFLLVFLGTEAPNRTITNEKYGGVDLTPIYETSSGSYLTEGWYYLVNPTPGAANITATVSPASNWEVCGINLSDVDLSDPVGNQNEYLSGSTKIVTTNVTEDHGNQSMHFLGISLGAVVWPGLETIAWGGSQTEVFQQQRDAFGNVTWGVSRKNGEGDGTTTMTGSWTGGDNENATGAQVEIRGLPGVEIETFNSVATTSSPVNLSLTITSDVKAIVLLHSQVDDGNGADVTATWNGTEDFTELLDFETVWSRSDVYIMYLNHPTPGSYNVAITRSASGRGKAIAWALTNCAAFPAAMVDSATDESTGASSVNADGLSTAPGEMALGGGGVNTSGNNAPVGGCVEDVDQSMVDGAFWAGHDSGGDNIGFQGVAGAARGCAAIAVGIFSGITLDTLTLASATEALAIVAGGTSVTMDPLTLASIAEAMTIAPGAVSMLMDELALAAALQAMNPFVMPNVFDRNFIRPRSRGFINIPISKTTEQ